MTTLRRRFPAVPAVHRPDAGAHGATVEVLGMRLAYDDVGSGPVVLCLHAIAHGAGDFRSLADRLRNRFRVVALDFPDHGGSDPDQEPATAQRYATVTRAFMNALGLTDVIVVGNSVGGGVAIELAAEEPGRIRALSLANPAGLFRRSGLSRFFLRGFARFFAAGARGARWFPRAFAAYYRRVLTEGPSHEQRARIVDAATEMAPALTEAWESFAEDASDLRRIAATVTCPVLALWAEKDPLNQLWMNRAGLARFPDLELRTFSAGHNAFLERPEEASRALLDFLGRRLPGPA